VLIVVHGKSFRLTVVGANDGIACGHRAHYCKCLSSWSQSHLRPRDKVTMPRENIGIGIPNLKPLNIALRCWAWLQKTEPSKPWTALNIQIPRTVMATFDAATYTMPDKGNKALF
jgi:hypothetical protein